jgi:dihydrofolate synthase/folylpolyglutamate synthase
VSSLAEARAWLDTHINQEATAGVVDELSLDRMRVLVDLLGEPQHAYPVIHVTGTNGKGSTAAMIASLVGALGLSVGRFSSPHLETLNERFEWDGEMIDDEALADVLERLRSVSDLLDGDPPSWFELVTAAAFLWFADLGVDVAVVEVGLLGRYDATNVVDGAVSVVTNVGRDHTDRRPGWQEAIAGEKAGIVRPGATLVLGERDPHLEDVFRAEGPEEIWRRDVDFGCGANRLALGGRLVDLRTPYSQVEEVFVPVHGEHQGENAAAALAAVDAFFGRATADEVVHEGFARVSLPGRFEVVGREPLVVLDGAHNPDGLEAFVATMAEFTPAGELLVVFGQLTGRDPDEMLDVLARAGPAQVIVCPAPSPRAVPVAELLAAAKRAGLAVESVDSVPEAVARGRELVAEDGALAVTGSLTVVGAARTVLVGD